MRRYGGYEFNEIFKINHSEHHTTQYYNLQVIHKKGIRVFHDQEKFNPFTMRKTSEYSNLSCVIIKSARPQEEVL